MPRASSLPVYRARDAAARNFAYHTRLRFRTATFFVADERINYAVVGLGRAGWDIHVNQLRGREDARIAAVVDPLPQRREQAAAEFGCKTYDSLPKMLRQSDVEVVVIATPSAQHAGDTKKAF